MRPMEELIMAMLHDSERMKITEGEWAYIVDELQAKIRKRGRPKGTPSTRAKDERRLYEQVQYLRGQGLSREEAMSEMAYPNPDAPIELEFEGVRKVCDRISKKDKSWENSKRNEEKKMKESLPLSSVRLENCIHRSCK